MAHPAVRSHSHLFYRLAEYGWKLLSMLVKLSSCHMPPVRKNKSNICFKQAPSVCLCVKRDGVIVHTCLYTVTVLICVLLQLTLCVNTAGGFAFTVNVCGRAHACRGTKRPEP